VPVTDSWNSLAGLAFVYRAWCARGDPIMPMAEHSILVGKSYRTPGNEVREVSAVEGGNVVYRLVAGAVGSGLESIGPPKRVPLSQFAAEVESEIFPDAV
jgi:hypothetical protein